MIRIVLLKGGTQKMKRKKYKELLNEYNVDKRIYISDREIKSLVGIESIDFFKKITLFGAIEKGYFIVMDIPKDDLSYLDTLKKGIRSMFPKKRIGIGPIILLEKENNET